MDQKLSRQRIIDLLAEISDLKVNAKKHLSSGIDTVQADANGDVILTREQLEALLVTQSNMNIYAFHSSGINNVGNHSSN